MPTDTPPPGGVDATQCPHRPGRQTTWVIALCVCVLVTLPPGRAVPGVPVEPEAGMGGDPESRLRCVIC
jgi:hypothetical protein